ncbi:TPA: hypothetical protein N2N45_002396 [Klebsiella aerogenes]|nr:hypothetical protein [Klebsiella aerogenes]
MLVKYDPYTNKVWVDTQQASPVALDRNQVESLIRQLEEESVNFPSDDELDDSEKGVCLTDTLGGQLKASLPLYLFE